MSMAIFKMKSSETIASLKKLKWKHAGTEMGIVTKLAGVHALMLELTPNLTSLAVQISGIKAAV